MGALGLYVCKTLLPVYDSCLLVRQVSQALQARVFPIFVSTRHAFEKQIEHVLNAAFGRLAEIKVISNRGHKTSVIHGLAATLEMADISTPILVSLGDMYFIDNPFLGIGAELSSNTVFVAKPFDMAELAKGGIVFTNGMNAVRLAAHAIPGNSEGVRWSGLSLLSGGYCRSLADYLLSSSYEVPPEGYFNHLLETGHAIDTKQTTDFVNCNSHSDLMIAALYRLAAIPGSQPTYQSFAERLRREVLRADTHTLQSLCDR